jgi:chloramphenicol 3-O-phosphotransferase
MCFRLSGIAYLFPRQARAIALTGTNYRTARSGRNAEGRLVFVGGEAGIGKSALVECLAQDLPDARWPWGACDGLFTPRLEPPEVADARQRDLRYG